VGSWTGEHRRLPTRWLLVSLALVAVGLACLVAGLQSRRVALSAPVSAPSRHASSVGTALSGILARSIPISLSIPAIGLSNVPLGELGLNLDGTVQVPTNVQDAGWYRLGPAPGQLGSAVILGHVDSHEGPAVFFNLRSLVPGSLIEVALADGSAARFTVTSVAIYDKATFPSRLVYGPHGDAELQLVTCGGTFDPSTGSYLSNVVVYSSFSGVTRGVG